MKVLNKAGMARREFIGAASAALLAGVAVQIFGCGTDSAITGTGFGSGAGGVAGPGDHVGVIAAPDTENHPVPNEHVAIITQAEINAEKYLILSIQGNADHNHTITLSLSDLTSITNGMRVPKLTTDTNDHNHTVTFN